MGKYELPNRLSRGKRFRQVLEDEEADADRDFWDQDFFQEEQKDECYETETESEDVPDSDFDDPEEEEDEEEVEEPKEVRTRKKLLPPGAKPKRKKLTRVPKKEVNYKEDDDDDDEHEEEEAEVGGEEDAAPSIVAPAPPVLRHSTIKRREQAELERMRQEKIRSKRKRQETTHKYKPLTQAEMLREAAQTEIKNLESLQQLVEMEEESKKKALEKKAKYMGPSIKIKSAKIDGMERTTMEFCNMRDPPRRFLPKPPPVPVQKSICIVTGEPAKYKDPVTGLGYANAAAFKEVQRRRAFMGMAML